MKRFAFSLVLVACTLATSSRAASDPRFGEAESLAKKKETAAAADVYRELLKDGVDSAGLRYNLGTLALDEGKVGEAVLHLRAAHRLAPGDADVSHNLSVALEARTDRLAGDPVVEPLHALGSTLSPVVARVAFAGPLALLGLLLAALGFVEGRARRAVGLVAGATAALAVLGGGLFIARKSLEGTREAVVLVDETNALKSPEADAASSFVAHAGLSGDVMEESGDFVRVRFENGLEAWLASKDVGFIE
jgi:hypothetical protein